MERLPRPGMLLCLRRAMRSLIRGLLSRDVQEPRRHTGARNRDGLPRGCTSLLQHSASSLLSAQKRKLGATHVHDAFGTSFRPLLSRRALARCPASNAGTSPLYCNLITEYGTPCQSQPLLDDTFASYEPLQGLTVISLHDAPYVQREDIPAH